MLSTWATLRFKWPELKGLARVLFERACLSMPVHFGVLSVHPTLFPIPYPGIPYPFTSGLISELPQMPVITCNDCELAKILCANNKQTRSRLTGHRNSREVGRRCEQEEN